MVRNRFRPLAIDVCNSNSGSLGHEALAIEAAYALSAARDGNDAAIKLRHLDSCLLA